MAKKDAIQADVSDSNKETNDENKDVENKDDETTGGAAPHSAAMERLRSIEEIAQIREKARESNIKGEEGNEADDETKENADDESKSDQGKNEKDEQEELDEKAEKPKTRTLNVNGEDQEFEEQKIIDAGIRALQKESTADQRLEEATQLLREAQKTQPSKDVDDVKTTPGQDAKAIADAIQYGEGDSAEKAVESLLQGKNEGLSKDDIRALVSDDLAFNNAMKSFRSEYPDIANDPTLMSLVGQREQALLDKGDKRPYEEMYLDIGKQITDWRDGLVKKESSDLNERAERKKQTKQIKTANKTATKSTKDDKPETRADILQNMRKARLQA